jgi:hypothetical protein
MEAHPHASGQTVETPPPCCSRTPPSTLWRQLDPALQKQLAQHWLRLTLQIRHPITPDEERNHAGR